ncbi:hypothetical protein L596_013084 [Steinernema carpocapsae]|uniref:Uncharacterized protein n=1 Tax=Steinernema carpocapsae TaxID=34508 RepID=A0A4U5NZB5_STECR|nr:hypothetical protein L596_013084 [Steinernema carpocapsae]
MSNRVTLVFLLGFNIFSVGNLCRLKINDYYDSIRTRESADNVRSFLLRTRQYYGPPPINASMITDENLYCVG